MSPATKNRIAVPLATVFVLLSLFHVVGAFGVFDDAPVVPELPDQPIHRPAPLSWLGVAVALAAAAVVVLARGDLILTWVPPKLSTFACVVLGLVFVARAIGEFRMVGFFKTLEGTDFAHWDSWLYTPLSLAIGLAALWLATTPRARRPASGAVR